MATMLTHHSARFFQPSLRASNSGRDTQTHAAINKSSSRRTAAVAKLGNASSSGRAATSVPRRDAPLAAAVASPPPGAAIDSQDSAPYPAEVIPRFLGESGLELIRVAAASGRFAPLMEHSLARGSTVNSYLLSSSEGNGGSVLIDLPERMHSKPFLEALRTCSAFSKAQDGGGIEAVVIGNYTPKKWDTLRELLDILPEDRKLKIYAARIAIEGLKKLVTEEYEDRLEMVAVTNRFSVEFGKGRELVFYSAKTSRWPDGICTYDTKTKLLFSHKLFCSNLYTESAADEGGWEALSEDFKYYFDAVVSSNSQQVNDILKNLALTPAKLYSNFVPKSGADIFVNDMMFIQKLFGLGNAKGSKGPQGDKDTSSSDDQAPLQVASICPHHGPAVKSTISQLLLSYGEWINSQIELVKLAQISVFYASAYGNTTSLSEAISRGIQKTGLGAVSVNLELATQEEIIEAIKGCRGFVVGSPTLGGHMPTPVQEALGLILRDPNSRNKPCGVFGSFGWSGEAVDEIEQKLRDSGYKQAFKPIRCKFSPDTAMLQMCEESGTDLGQEVKRLIRKEILVKRKASAQSAMAPLNLHLSENAAADQALGRIINSMCVLTSISQEGRGEDEAGGGSLKVDLAPQVVAEAEKEGQPIQEAVDSPRTSSAMVASWVTQASFSPPGLTVSVAKDRAAESFLQIGGGFVINIMKDDEEGSKMIKHFLKRFNPGQDRFEGIQVDYAQNGCPIIPGANAYLECSVVERLEAGDHWIVYAQVQNGSLLDKQALTAVHYRKTGSHY